MDSCTDTREQYFKLLPVAIDIANVDLLCALWKIATCFPKEQGEFVRESINTAVTHIAAKLDFFVDGYSFPVFVQKYDKELALEALHGGTDATCQFLEERGLLTVMVLATILLRNKQHFKGLDYVRVAFQILKRIPETKLCARFLTLVGHILMLSILAVISVFLYGANGEDDYRVLDLIREEHPVLFWNSIVGSVKEGEEIGLCYWHYFVNANLKDMQRDVFKHVGITLTYEKFFSVAKVVLAHKDCGKHLKREVVNILFKEWYNDTRGSTYQVLLELVYDYDVHHYLVWNLLTSKKENNELKNIAQELIKKHGYDKAFDPWSLDREEYLVSLEKIMN